MEKSSRILLAALAISASVCSGTAQTATRIKIADIDFLGDLPPTTDGLKHCAADLKAAPPQGRNWQNDISEHAASCLRDEGYYKASAKVVAEELPHASDKREYAVTIAFDAGPQYRLGDITFRNNTVFSRPELRSMFILQPGEVFNVSRMREGLRKMTRSYGERGFLNFTPVPDTLIDEEQHVVNVRIYSDEGKQYRLRKVEFSGVPQEVATVLAEQLGMRSGDVFNQRKLNQFAAILPSAAGNKTEVRRDDDKALVDLTFNLLPGTSPH